MSHHLQIPKKIKLFGLGCGCATLVVVIAGIVLLGTATSVGGWLSGAAKSIGLNIPKDMTLSNLPKEIALPNLPKELGLPQSIKLPQLPVNPFKLSQQDQIKLGDEVAAKQGLDKDAFADPQIKEISARMVKALPAKERDGWEWKFNALRTKTGTVNAIALPGGRVYIYDGLLKLTKGNADELAMIIGHEMAHVTEEHSAEKLRNAGLLKKASTLILQNSGGENAQVDAIKVWAAQLGEQLTNMQLSQSDEYQADSLGSKYMSAAGYDPKVGLVVMRKLGELSGKSKSMLSGVFSTHPPTDKRIQRLQKI